MEDFGVYVLLPDPARNELAVLGSEIENGYPVVLFHGDVCSGKTRKIAVRIRFDKRKDGGGKPRISRMGTDCREHVLQTIRGISVGM